jgi:hypothetical protein
MIQVVDDVANPAEGAEEVGIEDLVTEGAIEALEVGVLGGFSGLDMMKTNSVAPTPGEELE